MNRYRMLKLIFIFILNAFRKYNRALANTYLKEYVFFCAIKYIAFFPEIIHSSYSLCNLEAFQKAIVRSRNGIRCNFILYFFSVLLCTIMVRLLTLHTFLISLTRGSMVRGPLPQFTPTTAAPASSKRRQASGNGTSSVVISGIYAVIVITAGTPEE